ncbi:LPXTG cell wall anchor domain-containing protein [Carnobacterium maltaromaticum]|uniref:LPXTG cell wall anchor domain-containing protein n=1 Tax=Carnobacterium maltaromaticum TaxID=2751 RepID=UPI00191B9057|nr:LPXTG cell wall anchor domain-containing protein [Carnobacterium maltaromaticum]CAD5903098.1 exported hypothetical protein [Carnobacterium maltaromaticum]
MKKKSYRMWIVCSLVIVCSLFQSHANAAEQTIYTRTGDISVQGSIGKMEEQITPENPDVEEGDSLLEIQFLIPTDNQKGLPQTGHTETSSLNTIFGMGLILAAIGCLKNKERDKIKA